MNSQPTDRRILVIPAAGRGVRFRELGKNYPKCTLPVRGVPIIVTAIQMLADKSEQFEKVIIVASDDETAASISNALLPFNLKTPVIIKKLMKERVVDGPAVSLVTALVDDLKEGDFDVTVFLSDMLPSDQNIADHVANQVLADKWGYTPQDPEDYHRWCMVKETPSGLVFFDKPTSEPPTYTAACGVYRYKSAALLVESFWKYLQSADTAKEVQFSDIAMLYNEERPLGLHRFERTQFLDFGTLETYLQNKGINKCRSFNTIYEGDGYIVKSSELYDKMKDEIVWMEHAPELLKKYLPRIQASDISQGWLRMEKIRSQNLRDVALYVDRSYETWVQIFKSVREYLTDSYRCAIDVSSPSYGYGTRPFWEKIQQKTISRVKEIENIEVSNAAFEWLDTDFRDCIENAVDDWKEDIHYGHGDLHFANMFYCFHYKDLKLIDPRGDVRSSTLYDVAKLCHSVFGRYDYIDSELYTIVNGQPIYYDKGHENIEQAFRDVIFDSILTDDEREIVTTITASLFLSMIPLHKDKPEHCELFYKEFLRLANIEPRN